MAHVLRPLPRRRVGTRGGPLAPGRRSANAGLATSGRFLHLRVTRRHGRQSGATRRGEDLGMEPSGSV
ncbi:hypothetical protein EYF80_057653 [Liparis tanakae]|uniref:Uncharacterized protein n=1 Tax=Liparis tanakae TaxID=230148 RepID=A0A4Z2ETE6_9TELE|nr:hypothetical protein EYF80_057653 [Liparis tanakae]